MDEHQIAELKKQPQAVRRDREEYEKDHAAILSDANRGARIGVGPEFLETWASMEALRQAERVAQADMDHAVVDFEREKRERAEVATAQMVEANKVMAEASRAAASYSADAAAASRSAARWTLAVAVIAALGVLLQLWPHVLRLWSHLRAWLTRL